MHACTHTSVFVNVSVSERERERENICSLKVVLMVRCFLSFLGGL